MELAEVASQQLCPFLAHRACFDFLELFQPKVPDDIEISLAQLLRTPLEANRASMLDERLQIITHYMANMEALHQLRQSAGDRMDTNVWFDDVSIIHQAFNERAITEDTRDALLDLNKTYQRAKHQNPFHAKEEETSAVEFQIGTLKQADGHSHVIVKANPSRKSAKVGEIENGTSCFILWQDNGSEAMQIRVDRPGISMTGWVRQKNVCNIRSAGTAASSTAASEGGGVKLQD